jgi:hypothetical protein
VAREAFPPFKPRFPLPSHLVFDLLYSFIPIPYPSIFSFQLLANPCPTPLHASLHFGVADMSYERGLDLCHLSGISGHTTCRPPPYLLSSSVPPLWFPYCKAHSREIPISSSRSASTQTKTMIPPPSTAYGRSRRALYVPDQESVGIGETLKTPKRGRGRGFGLVHNLGLSWKLSANHVGRMPSGHPAMHEDVGGLLAQ